MRLFDKKDMSEMSKEELFLTGTRDIFLSVCLFVIGVILLGCAIAGAATGLPLSAFL